MTDEHEGHEHGADDHDHGHGPEEAFELELDTQSQIFLQMRAQNLELLRIAAQVAGFASNHGPLKPGDMKHAMRGIWDIYSEFYSWIDPEESGDDEEEDEE